jgi:hypothetical protein
MPRKLRVCFIQPAGGSVHAADDAASEEMAIRERVDNIRVTPISGARTSRPRAAVERFKLWQNGRRLRVLFLDGVADVQEQVAAIAKEWEEVVNIHFDFVTGATAELRISFAEKADRPPQAARRYRQLHRRGEDVSALTAYGDRGWDCSAVPSRWTPPRSSG